MAMKKGYWYLADEINAAGAEINFLYHSLLDDDGKVLIAEKGDEVVIPHPNFRFFGAMNPPTEYAGTKELNKALMSRFMVAKVDFPAPRIEKKILVNRTGITEDVADRMVNFAGEVRTLHGNEEIHFVLSTRDLLMWATMFKVYKKYSVSAEMTVLNKISEDDLQAIDTIMALHFKAQDDQKVATTKEDEDDE
jgi:cobaltochelatase CobS